MNFHPEAPLLAIPPHPATRATVIIPARNEEQSISVTLEALRRQTGLPDPNLVEVILLLNNCTDASASVASRYQRENPGFPLHIVERTLPSETAHVGTARRLLMDTAWHRLHHHRASAILSTDADTTVAPDWISCNLRAIEKGAEVVGGKIHLNPAEIANMDSGTLRAYRQDRRYQHQVARLESLLDPDPADPWPRHLEHFGASLACTPDVYARSGGLPPVKPLEDVAFIEACRRVDARIRHDPEVSIVTSARLDGRSEVGLSGQLRCWKEDADARRPHLVPSAACLTHRFSTLARLRRLRTLPNLPPASSFPECWWEPVREYHHRRLSQADYLNAIDYNRLIDETFHGSRETKIHHAIAALTRAIAKATSQSAPEHPDETSRAASTVPSATPAGQSNNRARRPR